jgi:hypothetical protein
MTPTASDASLGAIADANAPTAAIEAAGEGLLSEPEPLLDHRTRRRLIPARRASRGPHLAIGSAAHALLVALTAPITHLGRGSGADVRIEEFRVSRQHAIIACHGRGARLLDNRSANGTFLNGRRIVAANLRHGDVIRLGPVVLRYVEVA